MAIKVGNLSLKNDKGASFVDLDLNLRSTTRDGGKRGSILNDDQFQGNDMVMLKDASAIRNALQNLLTTQPGERFIEREFGTDLKRFIGEPVTDGIGESIGNAINSAIRRWEPRVRPVNIFTIANVEKSMFEIVIIVTSEFIDDEQIVIASELDLAKGVNVRFRDVPSNLRKN